MSHSFKKVWNVVSTVLVVLVVVLVFFMVVPSCFLLLVFMAFMVLTVFLTVLDIVIPLSFLSVSAHAVISSRTFTVRTDSPCPFYDMGKSQRIANSKKLIPVSQQIQADSVTNRRTNGPH